VKADNRRQIVAIIVGIAVATATAARAQTLYYDGDGNPANNNVNGSGLGAATFGATGKWQTANSWWDGVSATNQNWVDGATAVFAGNPGRLQLSNNVTAGAAQFNAAGYTIDIGYSNNSANAYSLTLSNVTGQAATILDSSGIAGYPAVSIGVPAGTTNEWDGKVSSGRMQITKFGAGTLNTTNQWQVTGTYGQPAFSVSGGRLNLIGNAGCNAGGCRVYVYNGCTLDVGANPMSARDWENYYGGTITSTNSGSITHASNFDQMNNWGTLAGNLSVILAGSGQTGKAHIFAAANTYSGGTYLTGAENEPLLVQNDAGLGTGRVLLSNNSGTTTLNLLSANPSVGSLESTNDPAGAKKVNLGNAGNSLASGYLIATWATGTNLLTLGMAANSTTNLSVGQAITSANSIPANSVITAIIDGLNFTINQNTTNAKSNQHIGSSPINTVLTVGSLNGANDVFAGTIADVPVTTNSVVKVGTGTWTLSGTNSYSGSTTVSNGTLVLNGSLASGRVAVKGGTFTGSGTLNFRLGATPALMTLTSGTLNVSNLTLNLTGSLTTNHYMIVDYSAGGSFITTAGGAFGSVSNLPAGYTLVNAAGKVTLQPKPSGTVLLLR